MSEFEDKLNNILNDQAAMGQIMALAQSLGGAGGQSTAPPPPPPPRQETQPAQPEGGQVDWNGVMNLLSSLGSGSGNQQQPAPPPPPEPTLPQLDPRLIQTGMRILSEYNRKDDKNMALLQALRPFVREERYAKLDRAIQIARLSRVIRVAFGVLKEQGGGSDV